MPTRYGVQHNLHTRFAMVAAGCALLVALATGCQAAPRLDSRIDNMDLPAEFRSRWLLETPGTFSDHLQDLIGRVVAVPDPAEGAGPGHTLRKSDFVEIADVSGADAIRIVTDSRLVYSSKIDSQFSASLEIAPFTGNVAKNQVQHITISDVARAWLDDRAALRQLLQELASLQHEPGRRYYLITGVILSHVQRQVFVETSTDSSISGTVFGANGKFYASDDRSSCEAMIFLDCFPIRASLRNHLEAEGLQVSADEPSWKLAEAHARMPAASAESDQSMKLAMAVERVVDKVRQEERASPGPDAPHIWRIDE